MNGDQIKRGSTPASDTPIDEQAFSGCKGSKKNETSYLEQRLESLGITDKQNHIKKVLNYPEWRFFTDDGKGNIKINYLSLQREPYIYWNEKRETEFFRIRWAQPADPKNKYHQPGGTEIYPFNTPIILEYFEKKETIKTLYITEGEFKAFKLSMCGIPCIGIGGIHNFKDPQKDRLHRDIISVITECHVENVVLLFDRDCLEVRWEEGKDLAKRPNSFFSALNTFNELLKNYDKQLYFSHVSLKCREKGIDDLICSLEEGEEEKCLSELRSLSEGAKNREYIETHLITGTSSYSIKSIFGLTGVQEFYDRYKEQLEGHDFNYKGTDYYVKDGKPVASWKGEENQYFRVGTDYYKLIVETSPNRQMELNIKPWKIGSIRSDYHNPNEFIKQIKKYDAFTNIPENDPEKYQRTIISQKDGFKSILYNRYFPVSHVPEKGDWPTIEKFLHHIFDYKNLKGDSFFEMILDYLQIIYLQPTQHLPILCLVSSERGTGKSKFLELLRCIFNENMRILDSERISSKFNGSWAGKLIVAVDESFIDTDKPTVVNRLKMIATNNTVPIEEKGKEAGEVPNFSKLIMCSNDETNFLKIEVEETRYWVVRVAKINPAELDTHIVEKMEKEISAFLWFLKNRDLHYNEKSRLWFDPEDYMTDALRKIQERTAPMLERHIKKIIREQFEYSGESIIKLPISFFEERLKEKYRFSDNVKVVDWFRDHDYKTGNATTYRIYEESGEYQTSFKAARLYTFKRSDYLSEE